MVIINLQKHFFSFPRNCLCAWHMSKYKKVNKEINCSHVANRTYIADSRYFHASWNPNLQFNQNKNNNLKIRTLTEKSLFYIMTMNGKNVSSAITDILLHVFESFLDPDSMSEGPFDDIVILKKQILLFQTNLS